MSINKLGPALDIEHVRKMRNRVYRVGIELEGGWKTLPKGTHLARDGSVRVSETSDSGPLQVGELQSPPMPVEGLSAWMKTYYPDCVDETCGMHVHLSFKSALTYQQLMIPSYPATIVAYITKWAKENKLPETHAIWPRLRGDNIFCQHVFYADQQVQHKEKVYDSSRPGHRYSVINYCHTRHSTLECRLLPMMDTMEQAISAIKETINITNAFLVASAAKEEKVKAVYVIDDEKLVEEEEKRNYV